MDIYVSEKGNKQKKKGSSWPLIAFLGSAVAMWYYDRRKKKQKLALGRQTQTAQFKAQQQTNRNPHRQSIAGNSAELRLTAMGETFRGANPTARQEWKKG